MQIKVLASFLFMILLVGFVSADYGSGDRKATEAAQKEAKFKEHRENIAKHLTERRSQGMKLGEDKDISCSELKNNEVACNRLHQIFVTCADKTGMERGKCIRKEVNPEKDKESKRNYLVVLLSDLQKRVEKANEKGRITDDQAAEVIAKIAEIKESTLNGDSRETIKSELVELKDLWKSIKQSVKESDSEDDSAAGDSGDDSAAGDSKNDSGDDSEDDNGDDSNDDMNDTTNDTK